MPYALAAHRSADPGGLAMKYNGRQSLDGGVFPAKIAF